jgi:hypothetical protein
MGAASARLPKHPNREKLLICPHLQQLSISSFFSRKVVRDIEIAAPRILKSYNPVSVFSFRAHFRSNKKHRDSNTDLERRATLLTA